jgi:hypothetical protein
MDPATVPLGTRFRATMKLTRSRSSDAATKRSRHRPHCSNPVATEELERYENDRLGSNNSWKT